MARKKTRVQIIARLTAKRFPSSYTNYLFSPKTYEFKDGVDIEQVVRFVLVKRNAIERAWRKKNNPGTDARDISYTSGLLKPLSSKALGEIGHLGQRDIHWRLRVKTYPFSQLNKGTREKLLHLPNSWIHKGAQWQLNSRKPAILLLR